MIVMTVLVVLCTGLVSPSVEFKELLENEKNNFRLVNTAVAFLGGVPAMINPADMSNTIPNEKVRDWRFSLCSLGNTQTQRRAAFLRNSVFMQRGFVKTKTVYYLLVTFPVSSLVHTCTH